LPASAIDAHQTLPKKPAGMLMAITVMEERTGSALSDKTGG
jgi:hypothetical protein